MIITDRERLKIMYYVKISDTFLKKKTFQNTLLQINNNINVQSQSL